MLTRTIFIYSVTYKVNLFGKASTHVQNCLRKEKHMYGTNKNIDGFYTKTTQIWGFRVKKKSVIPTYSIFQHVYGNHNLVSFYGRIIFCIVVFYILLFFQEKTLGNISFKLETKIMNFMTGFFSKKYNQGNSSVVNNMHYNLFTIFPLSGLFLLISSRISDFKCHTY
jgi:hypothetical protein